MILPRRAVTCAAVPRSRRWRTSVRNARSEIDAMLSRRRCSGAARRRRWYRDLRIHLVSFSRLRREAASHGWSRAPIARGDGGVCAASSGSKSAAANVNMPVLESAKGSSPARSISSSLLLSPASPPNDAREGFASLAGATAVCAHNSGDRVLMSNRVRRSQSSTAPRDGGCVGGLHTRSPAANCAPRVSPDCFQ